MTVEKIFKQYYRLVAALSGLADDKTFRLGRRGYVVRRAKGKGAKGFVAEKLD